MSSANVQGDHARGEIVLGPVYSLQTGVIGGAIGGLVMAVVAALTGLVTGMGLWYPLNLVGATLVRRLQSSPAAIEQFNLAALGAGFTLHILISVGLGVLFVSLLPTLPGRLIVWSVIVGLGLWAIAQFAVLPIVNPLMASEINVLSFVIANIAYSLTLGLYIQYNEPINECCYQVVDMVRGAQ